MEATKQTNNHILIVDDNPTDIDVLLEHLVGAGFRIAVAEDGEDALEQCGYYLPDLILLDVVLPGMDGFETCRRLKANDRTKEVPVIFMTALTDISDKVQGFAVGGVDYITKPIQQAEVLARVQTHLALRQLRQQLEEQNVRLQQEIAERQRAETALQQAHDVLEQRVAERTGELAQANQALTEQIAERERAEKMQTKLEAQLRQAQKMEAVGQLAGGIAHDFNNLLVVIIGYSNLLLNYLEADDSARKDIEQIKKAGERAAALTRQLLAFSRQQVLQPKLLNLNDVVSNVETMLQRLIGEDIKLITLLEPNLRAIAADPGQIEQIIVNLAVNARDAMPQGGQLTIETANVDLDLDYARQNVSVKPGPYVVLQVSDTGIGMDANTQTRLFEPFFTTKPQGQGTGLGLATVFGIVQQSGGHLAVASQPDQGTTFKIYLPQSEEILEEIKPEWVPIQASLTGSETILLVEDDPGVRTATHHFLEKYGYAVLEAAHGLEAQDLCQQHQGPIDLLITDVVMPEMSGRELVERLTSVRPEMPVLYVSGYTDNAMIRHGITEANITLLQKPFTADALARKVREILDAKSMEMNVRGF